MYLYINKSIKCTNLVFERKIAKTKIKSRMYNKTLIILA